MSVSSTCQENLTQTGKQRGRKKKLDQLNVYVRLKVGNIYKYVSAENKTGN